MRALRLAEQLGDALDGDQLPVPDDADPVANPLDLVQLVRGEEDRAAALALLGDQRQELLLHQRVEPAGRLVEDQQLGRVEAGQDQTDLLAVAARELAERTIEVGAEALGQGFGAADALDPPQTGEQPQRFASTRLLAVAEVSGQISEPGPDRDALALSIEAEDPGAARARMQQVEEGADRRRLAGAVRAEQAEDLARLHRKSYVLDAAHVAVEFGQPVGLDHRHALMLSLGPRGDGA